MTGSNILVCPKCERKPHEYYNPKEIDKRYSMRCMNSNCTFNSIVYGQTRKIVTEKWNNAVSRYRYKMTIQ